METRGKMKFYTHSEILDRTIGEKGTPDRNEYDAEMYLFHLGEMIKEARLAKGLTQEELGQLVGVQKAQISKIEKGLNLTLSTIVRILKAMGLRANIEIENIGIIPLCGI